MRKVRSCVQFKYNIYSTQYHTRGGNYYANIAITEDNKMALIADIKIVVFAKAQ